jgi:hypothetical protein
MAASTRNFIKLGMYLFALWFFFAIITPFLVSLSPAWQRYDAVQEEYNLDSGAVYYTDVPITQEAAEHVGQAVREGMRIRKLAAAEKNAQ